MIHQQKGFFGRFRYLFLVAVLAFGLLAVIGSNGGDDDGDSPADTTPPTVSSTTPADNATGVAMNLAITATFSEEMDSSTITTNTFTVNDGATNIAGTVNYSAKTATFTPTGNLAKNTEHTATITTGAKDAAGNELESDHTWSFKTGQTFNSGASLGDLLTYTIDTTVSPMTYSYEIVESDFGLGGTQGSGTLSQNPDGTYALSNDPGAGLILLPNTLIVGGAEIDVGGTATTMLFAGVPALTTNYTATEIEGTYNYINFECGDALVGGVCNVGYKSFYGTFKVDAGGTWEECQSGDIDVQASTSNGIWTDLGGGLIKVSSGGTEIGKAMLLPSAGGGKVIIIDLKDRPGLGAGPGILVGVKKQDISTEDLGGNYHFNDDDGGYGDITVNNGSNSYSGTQCDASNNCVAINGTFTRNDPWNGWLTDSNSYLILILPGDGVFLQTEDQPGNDWITIGGIIP